MVCGVLGVPLTVTLAKLVEEGIKLALVAKSHVAAVARVFGLYGEICLTHDTLIRQ